MCLKCSIWEESSTFIQSQGVKSLWCSDFDVRWSGLSCGTEGHHSLTCLVPPLLLLLLKLIQSAPHSNLSKRSPTWLSDRGCPTCIDSSTFKSSFSICSERENYKMKPCPTGFTHITELYCYPTYKKSMYIHTNHHHQSSMITKNTVVSWLVKHFDE